MLYVVLSKEYDRLFGPAEPGTLFTCSLLIIVVTAATLETSGLRRYVVVNAHFPV